MAERAIADLVATLLADRALRAEAVHDREIAAVPERHATLARPLPPELDAALVASGVNRLWSHQVAALDAVREERDVLLSTPTASGKSLVFQLPVLEAAASARPGRALFLFPLKALGQDQLAKLRALASASGLAERADAEIYDGDTPTEVRARIRGRPPRVLVTNPDMLHLGILPSADSWRPFLSELAWIVLDELHVYRGIFGAHVHHVLARLVRVATAFGARPRVIAASATAANAGEFAERLLGRPFVEVSSSGAPRSAARMLLLRPSTSPYETALATLVRLLEEGAKTIVFTKARRITELLVQRLERRRPDLAARVRSYRAGFLPSERRAIESDLFAGRLDGVVATSALELGIDVGGLDACVLVGYPGSRMATWQRSGRVGRGGRPGLTVLVAQLDALDQYLLDHPEELFDRPFERLIVDPDNEPVARAHLLCAAAERPLDREADRELLERRAPLVGELLRDGELAESEDRARLVARRRRPHRDVDLRGSGSEYVIVDRDRGTTIGTIDGARVFQECHPGAIYLHGARSYAVADLDVAARRVKVVADEVDYFTSALSEKETEILEQLGRRDDGWLAAGLGRVRVTERVVGFERRRATTLETLGQESLDLPPTSYETVAFWIEAPAEVETEMRRAGDHWLGSLHAAEHTTIALLPLLALCDRNDLGGISLAAHPQLPGGGYFVYDGHAGGVGIAARGFAELPDLLARVADLLRRCPCESGCPSCVQSPKCGNGNRPLDKRGARRLIEALLAPGRPAARAEPRRPIGADSDARERREGTRRSGTGERPRGRRGTPAAREADATSSEAPARRQRASPPRSTVLFDLETLRSAEEVGGWNRAHRMGIAVGVVLQLEEGRFEVYREERVADLVAALKSAELVVGFNSLRFDYAVLSGYTGEDFARTLPTLDLLEDIRGRLGFRLSLEHLARETLGVGKSADGLQSLEWVRQGRFDLVEDYCRRDVEVLRDLYLFGRREGYLIYSGKSAERLRLPVDW